MTLTPIVLFRCANTVSLYYRSPVISLFQVHFYDSSSIVLILDKKGTPFHKSYYAWC